jgi:hypothetical protein
VIPQVRTTTSFREFVNNPHLMCPAPPNFISDIFYLCAALFNCGYLPTISVFDDMGKHYDELRRHLDTLQGDGSWMGVRDFSFVDYCRK